MKYRRVLAVSLLALAGAGWGLWGYSHPPAPPQPTAATLGTAATGKDEHAAAGYIESSAKGTLLLDESDPVAENEIGFWEDRILSFVRDQDLQDVDTTRVYGLAVKTASLFSLLKTASARQKAGLEPYTSQTGFDTMTLVMNMEHEFKEALGITFSDYLNSLDEELIKKLV